MTLDEKFAAFWDAYPNKKGKADALKAFKAAMKATTLEKLLDAIKLYKQHKPEWMAFKHPATWLRAGCWDDEWEVKAPTFSFTGHRPYQPAEEPRAVVSPERRAELAAKARMLVRGALQ